MSAATPQTLPSEAVAVNAGGGGQRLLALDAFRGLTIAAMILVNNPGSWGDLYWPLDHAPWHGWTPTDLVFPFFLFIVGTALAYSLRKYRDGAGVAPAVYGRIARRPAVLLFPGWLPGLLLRSISYASGAAATLDLATLRLPGVLVRIALVYLATSLVVLHTSFRTQIALAATLLLGYWALLAWLPNPGDYQANLSPDGNVAKVVDLALLGESHLYTQAQREKTDPEGLLSTLPAIATALLGYWTGLAIQRRGITGGAVARLVSAGVACFAV